MIAPGNHLNFDSLRGAPPPGEAMALPRQCAKFQFVATQNDTERVRQETKIDHVRHDLSAATRRQIPNLYTC